ncbi:hypothetical protein Tco_1055144, partial [Tanacetum coccineum]
REKKKDLERELREVLVCVNGEVVGFGDGEKNRQMNTYEGGRWLGMFRADQLTKNHLQFAQHYLRTMVKMLCPYFSNNIVTLIVIFAEFNVALDGQDVVTMCAFVLEVIMVEVKETIVTPVVTTTSTVNGTPLANTVVNHAEKPENFSGLHFKRWKQKIFFYLTTLNLAWFLTESAPQIVEGEADAQSVSAVDAWKHSEFL